MSISLFRHAFVLILLSFIGAFLGAGTMTPIASAGHVGNDTAETLVSALFISVAIASFIAVGLSLWGLRRAP